MGFRLCFLTAWCHTAKDSYFFTRQRNSLHLLQRMLAFLSNNSSFWRSETVLEIVLSFFFFLKTLTILIIQFGSQWRLPALVLNEIPFNSMTESCEGLAGFIFLNFQLHNARIEALAGADKGFFLYITIKLIFRKNNQNRRTLWKKFCCAYCLEWLVLFNTCMDILYFPLLCQVCVSISYCSYLNLWGQVLSFCCIEQSVSQV